MPKKQRSSYDEAVEQAADTAKEKDVLRTLTWWTFEDEESLLPRSAQHGAWKHDFCERFEALRRNGIHSAKKIAQLLARQGFKTLSGGFLTTRQIDLLREKYRADGALPTPEGSRRRRPSGFEGDGKKRKSHPTYRQ